MKNTYKIEMQTPDGKIATVYEECESFDEAFQKCKPNVDVWKYEIISIKKC